MNPALLGLAVALSWGSADFIARFTGRGIGHHLALFGMLAISTAAFSLILWFGDAPLIWNPAGLWSIAVMGIGMMTATLLLYWGLARGPISIVAPIAGSYPVINIVFAVFTGTLPTLVQWAAIAVVMVGVIVVAKCAGNFADGQEHTAESLRKTVIISLGAAFILGFTVIGAQEAGSIYGELAAVCFARWVSLVAIIVVIAWRRQSWKIPMRWWPLIALQGLLDGGAFIGLASSGGPGAEIAAVVASAFSAVTIVLARLFLKETISLPQGGGIAMIVIGVATLMAP
ncbi:MAG: DMT family transporter [Rhodospirillaceae bacterium]|nr:DMT family transporter [Rhodospirillaceae bacterium]